MVSEFVIESIKSTLGCERISFHNIDWVFNAPTKNTCELLKESRNQVHGILIFNLALTTLGDGNLFTITDKKLGKVVYQVEDFAVNTFVAPWVYFIPDNTFSFQVSSAEPDTQSFGFNYVTIRKEKA